MERVRQAMESALEQKWVPLESPVVFAPAVHREKEKRNRSIREIPRDGASYIPVSEDVFARNNLVAAIRSDTHREAYSVLQAGVVEQMAERNWVSLGITSPATGTGKTLTALNLSIALATQANRNVLLLDLDLKNPSVHSYLEYEPERGLEDCLFEGTAVAEATFSPSIDGLAVLPVKAANRNSSQILGSDGLRRLLSEIRREDPDRLIIVDLPSITSASDARAYNALVDGTLLIVEDTTTREAHLRVALELIGKSKLLGTVLNRAELIQ